MIDSDDFSAVECSESVVLGASDTLSSLVAGSGTVGLTNQEGAILESDDGGTVGVKSDEIVIFVFSSLSKAILFSQLHTHQLVIDKRD